ncbi:MAG: hypothetical protein HND56_03825 [Pseudomonadota bacterium]|jgi:hypothetical protein|nr:hypothetical protein [Pseudomonadota bacterium]QKK04870.1 MAG: hypothetical protein HND56_03825 [Pseudomonadota bacterium]|tara:strand:+ start:115 stop:534 length:420 start_codon:yes stop_codon:yes gene_type:complete
MDNIERLDDCKKRSLWRDLPHIIISMSVVLALFFALYAPSAHTIPRIESISITAPVPLKPPAIEAGDVVKLVTRVQGVLQIPRPGGDSPHKKSPALLPDKEKIAAYSRSQSAHIIENSGYIACCLAHHIYPRAPPVFLI